MKTRTIILILIPAGLLVAAGLFIGVSLFKEDSQKILISTDRDEYKVGETVRIQITNYEDHPVQIYCPMTCALGNFPTTVEKAVDNGEWEYLAGFCPSITPLFGDYQTDGDFIVHPLAAGESYHLEISNFAALGLQQAEQLRIMYYLDSPHTTILSAPFTMNP
jgi:hypothetical protein